MLSDRTRIFGGTLVKGKGSAANLTKIQKLKILTIEEKFLKRFSKLVLVLQEKKNIRGVQLQVNPGAK